MVTLSYRRLCAIDVIDRIECIGERRHNINFLFFHDFFFHMKSFCRQPADQQAKWFENNLSFCFSAFNLFSGFFRRFYLRFYAR